MIDWPFSLSGPEVRSGGSLCYPSSNTRGVLGPLLTGRVSDIRSSNPVALTTFMPFFVANDYRFRDKIRACHQEFFNVR